MKKIYIIFAAIFLCIPGEAQIITTIAGTGVAGYSGDSSIATSAEIGYFNGIATDNHGNIYIADANNYRVRKIDAITNIITTIAGTGETGYGGDSGLAVNAVLGYPDYIAIDKKGNIYIDDGINYRVRKIDTNGVITTVAGNGEAGFSGDGGLAVDASIVSSAIAVDDTGNLYINDYGTRVRKVNYYTGIITTVAGNGEAGFSGDGGLAIAAQIHSDDIAIDKLGNLYIADNGNYRIRKVDKNTGLINTIAGDGTVMHEDSVLATSTGVLPSLMAFDQANNLYFSEATGSSRIRKIDTNGIITTIAGNGVNGFSGDGGPAKDAELNSPIGIAFDSYNNMYIADQQNKRARKIAIGIDSTTSVNSIISNIANIGIYPNPAQNELTITGSDIQQVTISNMVGQTVFTQSYHTQKAQINIANLPQGLYFVKVNDGYVQKVVKE